MTHNNTWSYYQAAYKILKDFAPISCLIRHYSLHPLLNKLNHNGVPAANLYRYSFFLENSAQNFSKLAQLVQTEEIFRFYFFQEAFPH